MHVTIEGQQLELSSSLRERVEGGFADILDKYFSHALDATARFSREGHQFRAVLAVHLGRGMDLHAEALAGEAYSAFDRALEKLAKRLRRHKRRLKDHHKAFDPREALSANYNIVRDFESEEEIDSLPENPLIIAEEQATIPSLSVSQAVAHMDLTDGTALLFKNAKHGNLNMVYRRKDGHIGWLDPREG